MAIPSSHPFIGGLSINHQAGYHHDYGHLHVIHLSLNTKKYFLNLWSRVYKFNQIPKQESFGNYSSGLECQIFHLILHTQLRTEQKKDNFFASGYLQIQRISTIFWDSSPIYPILPLNALQAITFWDPSEKPPLHDGSFLKKGDQSSSTIDSLRILGFMVDSSRPNESTVGLVE